jgi:hypothetical protein
MRLQAEVVTHLIDQPGGKQLRTHRHRHGPDEITIGIAQLYPLAIGPGWVVDRPRRGVRHATAPPSDSNGNQ